MNEKKINDLVLAGHRVFAVEDVTARTLTAADAVVSIGNRDEALPRAIARSGKPYLRLTFQDYDHADAASAQLDDLRELIDFAKKLEPSARLLVHCHAGVSGSTAALAIVFASRSPDFDYDSVFEAVYRIRPQAFPNKRLVAFADNVLG